MGHNTGEMLKNNEKKWKNLVGTLPQIFVPNFHLFGNKKLNFSIPLKLLVKKYTKYDGWSVVLGEKVPQPKMFTVQL